MSEILDKKVDQLVETMQNAQLQMMRATVLMQEILGLLVQKAKNEQPIGTNNTWEAPITRTPPPSC